MMHYFYPSAFIQLTQETAVTGAMQIKVHDFLQSFGFACCKLVRDHGGGFMRQPARMAFVTPFHASQFRTRSGEGSMTVRYGDVVGEVTLSHETRVFRVPPGHDAGLALTIGDRLQGALLPFTGRHMLKAMSALRKEIDLAPDTRHKALQALDAMFDLILFNPDIDRFGHDLIAQAYQARLFGDHAPNAAIDMPAFSRKGRYDLIMARIGMYRDMLLPNCRMHMDAMIASGKMTPADPAITAFFQEHGSIRRRILNVLCTDSASHASVTAVTSDALGVLPGLGYTRLTGAWVDAVSGAVEKALDHAVREKENMIFYTGRDIDLLTIPDEETGSVGILSWPTRTRYLVFPHEGQQYTCLSPEEIPTEAMILEKEKELHHILKQRFLTCWPDQHHEDAQENRRIG